MKRLFTLANLALLSVVLLAGCSPKHPIVGKWVPNDKSDDAREFTFLAEGIMVLKAKGITHEGLYTIEGERIKLSPQDSETVWGDYSINNGILTITVEGETRTFRKK